jgi:hypothetical protein
MLGSDVTRARSGLNNEGSYGAQALYFGLGLFATLVAYLVRLGLLLKMKKVMPAGLAQNPGLVGLWPGPGPGPDLSLVESLMNFP